MRITKQAWNSYVNKLSKIDHTAAVTMKRWLDSNRGASLRNIVNAAYLLTGKYGEAAAALACEMYDQLAVVQGKSIRPATPANPPGEKYVENAVSGTIQDKGLNSVPDLVSRMVKQTGADTTLQNAKRDGAYFAWVPSGDTCAFCITLASRGWQKASKKTIKGNHAEHIHNNCNCEFAISFDGPGEVEGYDPDKYKDMYYGAEGSSPQDRINYMRRQQYAEDKDYINAQKRAAHKAKSVGKKREDVVKNDKDSILKVSKVISGHEGTPKEANPNAVIDHIGRNGVTETRSFYNERGLKRKDITTHDHGHPKQHPYGKHGEHVHEYEWNDDGSLKKRTTRDLTVKERKENSDIL